MRTVARYWKAFRAWPGIAQAAVWMTLFVLVGWMIPAPVKAADLVLRNKQSGMELRLLETPCSHAGTLAILAEEWRPKFKNARILNAKGFIENYGCWIEEGELAVVIFDDGTEAAVKLSAFTDPMT